MIADACAVAVTLAFIVLLVEFVWRYQKDRPVKRQYHALPNWRFLARPKNDTGSPTSYGELHGSTGSSEVSERDLEATPGGHKRQDVDMVTGGRASHALNRRGVWTLVGLLIVGTTLIIAR